MNTPVWYDLWSLQTAAIPSTRQPFSPSSSSTEGPVERIRSSGWVFLWFTTAEFPDSLKNVVKKLVLILRKHYAIWGHFADKKRNFILMPCKPYRFQFTNGNLKWTFARWSTTTRKTRTSVWSLRTSMDARTTSAPLRLVCLSPFHVLSHRPEQWESVWIGETFSIPTETRRRIIMIYIWFVDNTRYKRCGNTPVYFQVLQILADKYAPPGGIDAVIYLIIIFQKTIFSSSACNELPSEIDHDWNFSNFLNDKLFCKFSFDESPKYSPKTHGFSRYLWCLNFMHTLTDQRGQWSHWMRRVLSCQSIPTTRFSSYSPRVLTDADYNNCATCLW